MSIDKQRVRGVELLEQLGYRWDGVAWHAPLSIVAEADAMHGLLMDRADVLAGATKGATEEEELEAIGGALEAYEAKRGPLGKVPGGKG